ncbi:cytochrome c oxidase subunit 4 isoform 1, mitochondrial-like [Pollicipes pollicipes]|uniref:cytochrome c oxidase subunit 4 isoform 1, mitochondrial-like n=1 Tax=Pollicipes pollicipes TaxID=41117 RepID=UPI0018859BCB|nr:cytochrome c oxidase subunit 4 isoform 1, mitochondrial-like [Pollicipes pollicipes]XP_037085707.1 cytochrome c oxidase subunit 4 isoform 1, mitochondrial-like [Pollicipes pollicipes]
MASVAGVVLRRCVQLPAAARLSTSARALGGPGLPTVVERHGSREVLGYGFNGEPNYMDRVDFPIPAVRFKEDTAGIKVLREKEKGDWKKLTPEEVQELYRATFCKSFAEIQAPTGEWKLVLGGTLVACSIAVWIYLWMKVFVYDQLPDTITNPSKMEAQVQRMIDLRMNPVEGIGSKWDYEKGQWKN